MAIRILLVDDHALVREALIRLLSAQDDLEVVGTACDCADAISCAERLKPDVLLLDIALPDRDGFEAIAPIRERAPDTHVLMLSMHAEPEYARLAVDRGAAGLVSKSDCPESLIEAIRTAARGGSLPIEGELSPREREILERITNGESNEEIGQALAIRLKTVDGHCERLMAKLDIHTRAGLVSYGRRLGF